MEFDPKYFWIDRLKADPVWGKIRFKRLDKGHYTNPNIDLSHELIDVVNFNVFVRIEEDRLPLFLDTLMLTARSVYIDYPERRIIAVLDPDYLRSSYRGLIIEKYFRGKEERLAFFRNEEINPDYLNMDPKKVTEEALKIRNKIKAESDMEENPIDMDLELVPPFKVSDDIRLIIIGQDPTVKNQLRRKYIKKTLNLDKSGGSLRNYIEKVICKALDIDLNNVYATNIFKYFYETPPARTPDVMYKHLDMNLMLLRNEINAYPDVPVISLGEPVLQMLSKDNYDKVRKYWDYQKGSSGNNFRKCTDNDLDRPFYPFPHQPSSVRKFYSETIKQYLNFVKKDSWNK